MSIIISENSYTARYTDVLTSSHQRKLCIQITSKAWVISVCVLLVSLYMNISNINPTRLAWEANMYRFIYRKRRIFLYLFACLMLYSMLRMVADDSFEKRRSLFQPNVHKTVTLRNFGSPGNQHHERRAAAKPHKRAGHELRRNSLKRDKRNHRKGKHPDHPIRHNQLIHIAKRKPVHKIKRNHGFLWKRKRRPKKRRLSKSKKLVHGAAAPRQVARHKSVPPKQDWIPPPHAGERGVPVLVKRSQLSARQLHKYKKGKYEHNFNVFVSDLVSVNRSLPEVPDTICRSQQYQKTLPSTSVVIIFHNEAWSTLLRTVYSVLNTSPAHVLHQVILVDDFSDMEHLKKPLEDFLSKPELRKVKLVRGKSREGLIKARLLGLSHVSTATVVFLDSHCECLQGWLEPLLDRIATDPTTVVVPVIDSIDSETFTLHLTPARYISVGTFAWTMLFRWMPIQTRERHRRRSDIDPVHSPTMPGGLFAIDVKFFYKLGTYDPGMKIWGGENLELSFKIWMCGGTMEIVPCSRVGHVFRDSSPHSSGGFRHYLSTNLGRVSAVWLDEYSYYANKARRVKETDVAKAIGDISERLELKRRLKCHSFAWYLQKVLPELYLPADRIADGPIENKMTGLCIVPEKKFISLEKCRNAKGNSRRSMWWHMNPDEFAVYQDTYDYVERYCMDYSGKTSVDYLFCHNMGGNQRWTYNKDKKQLLHVVTNLCAEIRASLDKARLVMAPCNHTNPHQQWLWNTVRPPGPSWRRDLAAGKKIL